MLNVLKYKSRLSAEVKWKIFGWNQKRLSSSVNTPFHALMHHATKNEHLIFILILKKVGVL